MALQEFGTSEESYGMLKYIGCVRHVKGETYKKANDLRSHQSKG